MHAPRSDARQRAIDGTCIDDKSKAQKEAQNAAAGTDDSMTVGANENGGLQCHDVILYNFN